jgi:hypothetical protein
LKNWCEVELLASRIDYAYLSTSTVHKQGCGGWSEIKLKLVWENEEREKKVYRKKEEISVRVRFRKYRSNQSNAMAGFGKSCNTVCLWAVDGSHFCTVHHFLLIFFFCRGQASNTAKIQIQLWGLKFEIN